MCLMLFVLIASVLSRVAHKKLLASEKTDIRYGMGRAKNKFRGRDGALREFDIPPILHIKHQNVLRQGISRMLTSAYVNLPFSLAPRLADKYPKHNHNQRNR